MNKVKILEERTVKCAYGTFAKEVIVDDGIPADCLCLTLLITVQWAQARCVGNTGE